MIRGIHHPSLSVADMGEMLGFYRDLLGFEEAVEMAWEAPAPEVDAILGLTDSAAEVRILRAGNAYLELIAYAAPPGRAVDPEHPVSDRGHRHFALDVVGIEAEYERLLAAGVRVFGPPAEVEVAGHPHKTFYLRDPEGNVLEMQELLTAENPMALPGGR